MILHSARLDVKCWLLDEMFAYAYTPKLVEAGGLSVMLMTCYGISRLHDIPPLPLDRREYPQRPISKH